MPIRSNPATARSDRTGYALGIVLALLAVAMCGAAAVLSWSASTGIVLGLDLSPASFRSPGSGWPFVLGAGVLVACILITLLRLPASSFRRATGLSMTVVGLIALAAITIVVAAGPAMFEFQSGWQRVAYFLSQSEGLALLFTVSAVISVTDRRRSRAGTRPED